MDHALVFLKLGGSLITHKDHPRCPRTDVIERLASEIALARQTLPHLRLLIGHGSGSFGHQAAKKHATRNGVHTRQEWLGFAEVWKDARALNQIVIEALTQAGMPVIAFPPSATMLAREGRATWFEARPLIAALEHGLIPVVQGDVAFDTQWGGTILSTEAVFARLAGSLKPHHILLAGIEPGIWADYPQCTQLIDQITPAMLVSGDITLRGSSSVDVTGGMREKVQLMFELIEAQPTLMATIFSGAIPGNLQALLCGNPVGTTLRASPIGM